MNYQHVQLRGKKKTLAKADLQRHIADTNSRAKPGNLSTESSFTLPDTGDGLLRALLHFNK